MGQQDQQTYDDQPDVIKSDPAAVPASDRTEVADQARDTDDNQGYDGRAADEALDDRGTFDDPVVADTETRTDDARIDDARTDDDLDRGGPVDEADRSSFAEPAPQPTAYGAATVGGAVAAAAMAGKGRAEEHDVRDEDTAATGDGAVDDRLDETHARRAGFDQSGAGERDADRHEFGEPVPATGLMPGDVPADPIATLFAADAAQGFRDRWRDVQLRFVDDPRGAAGEAQGLVEEAVESLATALAERKNTLGGWESAGSADTEQLRVAVRRYRDFLDRLLGL